MENVHINKSRSSESNGQKESMQGMYEPVPYLDSLKVMYEPPVLVASKADIALIDIANL
jgi:hypothetical protein